MQTDYGSVPNPNSKAKAPCKGCEDRHPACHDTCDLYREFKDNKHRLHVMEREFKKSFKRSEYYG